MKRLTIKDLAKLLNLSTSTISRALSDHPDISDETKERVQKVAMELNYRKNLHARFFRKQHSGLIALILPEINMFYSPSLLMGVNKTIDNSRFSLITFLSNDSYKREKEIIQHCLDWAVEGILLSLSNETNNLNHLQMLESAKIKCVLFDKSLKNTNYPSVLIDSVESSYLAVSHLIQKGHRNILGIFGNPKLKISQDRLIGYKNALHNYGIPCVDENIVFTEQNSHLDNILPAILKLNKTITSIFVMSDELLSKTLYHLRKMNITVPNDISVIAVSDGNYPYLVHPCITHIKDSGVKMGKAASKVLLELISNKSSIIDEPIYVKTKLIELKSVRDISNH